MCTTERQLRISSDLSCTLPPVLQLWVILIAIIAVIIVAISEYLRMYVLTYIVHLPTHVHIRTYVYTLAYAYWLKLTVNLCILCVPYIHLCMHIRTYIVHSIICDLFPVILPYLLSSPSCLLSQILSILNPSSPSNSPSTCLLFQFFSILIPSSLSNSSSTCLLCQPSSSPFLFFLVLPAVLIIIIAVCVQPGNCGT